MNDDLSELSQQYPEWRFGSVWTTAASRPDARRLTAMRDGILLTAWTAPELRLKIEDEEVHGRQ